MTNAMIYLKQGDREFNEWLLNGGSLKAEVTGTGADLTVIVDGKPVELSEIESADVYEGIGSVAMKYAFESFGIKARIVEARD